MGGTSAVCPGMSGRVYAATGREHAMFGSLLCVFNLHHRWHTERSEDGEPYTRCLRCGKDRTEPLSDPPQRPAGWWDGLAGGGSLGGGL